MKKLFNRFSFAGAICVAACLLGALLATNAAAQSNVDISQSPCVKLTFTGEHNSPHYAWKNQDNPLCKEAIESLRPASLVVLGFNTEKDSFGEQTLQTWLVEMAKNSTWNARFSDGLTFTDAVGWLKETRYWAEYQYYKIPLEIYGRQINGQEQTDYRAAVESKKTWYAPLFFAEKNKLNQSPALREEMIKRAFQNALNRQPTAAELKYWKPRQEIYREITAEIKK